jgi:metal-responsive CopG/Arc/MetJ family transcriptional regulator
MRTTIELPDELRARLLALAAQRGEKGFSGIVREAVAAYLAAEDRRPSLVSEARGVLGTLTPEDADRLNEGVDELRARWR